MINKQTNEKKLTCFPRIDFLFFLWGDSGTDDKGKMSYTCMHVLVLINLEKYPEFVYVM